MARTLHVAPGGARMQALGAARLGLATVLVAPIGRARGPGLLRSFFEWEGVEIAGRDRHRDFDPGEP